MQSEDRLIHFSTELLHAPATRNVPELQRLYYELSQTRSSYDSSDFGTPPQFRFHSTRSNKAQSAALFLPDRMVLIEEWVDMALSRFLEKIRDVVPRAASVLSIPAFLAQTVTLRSTFALTHFEDARVFLMDHVCNQANRLTPFFPRPIGVTGLRLIFPETPEHPGNLHVIIESFKNSLNEVFVEVRGIFPRQPLAVDALDTMVGNIQFVRGFITDSVFPFLNQYDAPGTNPHG